MKDKRNDVTKYWVSPPRFHQGWGRARKGVLRLQSVGLFAFVWKRISFPLYPALSRSLEQDKGNWIILLAGWPCPRDFGPLKFSGALQSSCSRWQRSEIQGELSDVLRASLSFPPLSVFLQVQACRLSGHLIFCIRRVTTEFIFCSLYALSLG